MKNHDRMSDAEFEAGPSPSKLYAEAHRARASEKRALDAVERLLATDVGPAIHGPAQCETIESCNVCAARDVLDKAGRW